MVIHSGTTLHHFDVKLSQFTSSSSGGGGSERRSEGAETGMKDRDGFSGHFAVATNEIFHA